MIRNSKIRQVSSMMLLMLTMTFLVLVIYSFRLASRGSDYGFIFLVLLTPFTVYGFASSILFFILYPLGKLNKYIYDTVSGPDSPFANERLPTQIIAPVDRDDAK